MNLAHQRFTVHDQEQASLFLKCLFVEEVSCQQVSFFRFNCCYFIYRSKCKAFVAIETGEYSYRGIMGHD